MADKGSHEVRNGTIATVVGGIILAAVAWVSESVWNMAVDALRWLWSVVVAGYVWLGRDYAVPAWLLVTIAPLALAEVIRFGLKLRPKRGPTYKDYTEDRLFGAVWRWQWAGENLSRLWAFCPSCDGELVYDDSTCHRLVYTDYDPPCATEFSCESCGGLVRAKFDGDKNSALGRVEREIRRRLRVGEKP
ncbi:hypothetical protein [Azospirillum sp. B2RO_4]|uniref:hypothetical protein n=1 Tax=Azospirillum sp. B2RO_4 TaxID=3027796 RepID=UPI003DA96B25